MILTDREIKIGLARGLIELEPAPKEDAFSSTSVDLTLHSQIRQFRDEVESSVNIDPAKPGFKFSKVSDLLTEPFNIEQTFSLQRRRLLLAWTRETLRLPITSRLAARVEGKSSLARVGLGIHITAPTIHAGFEGQIQLEILNHGPTDVVLRPGMRICQLIFETTLGTPEKGYAGAFAGQGPQ